MAQAAAEPSGPVDSREVALIDDVSDERVAVASANAKFEATIAKSDVLLDDESSAVAKRIKEKVLADRGGETHCSSRQVAS